MTFIAELKQPGRALQVAQMQLTNNETFLFQILWSPYGDAARVRGVCARDRIGTGLGCVRRSRFVP